MNTKYINQKMRKTWAEIRKKICNQEEAKCKFSHSCAASRSSGVITISNRTCFRSCANINHRGSNQLVTPTSRLFIRALFFRIPARPGRSVLVIHLQLKPNAFVCPSCHCIFSNLSLSIRKAKIKHRYTTQASDMCSTQIASPRLATLILVKVCLKAIF